MESGYEKRFNFDQKVSKEVFENKYQIRGENTPHEVFYRVAEEIAEAEKTPELKAEWKKKFYDIMDRGLFFPAGRPLANARIDSPMKQYNNCFVLQIEDSMESITQAIQDYMMILKKSGGVGFNISKLRPKDAPLSVGGVSTGPLSFCEIFDTASKTISAHHRRGATMIIMNCDHPDIEAFVTYKRGDENKKLTQANISVGVTDAFVEAVENDDDWDLIFEGTVHKTVKARDLWEKIMENSMKFAEPGVLFLDAFNRGNALNWHHNLDTTNPCGEQNLPAYIGLDGKKYYGSCNLGSINLSNMVVDPFTDEAFINWPLVAEAVTTGVRFLDNVIDRIELPLEAIENELYASRRVGLGFMGLGDLFNKMKIKYGSEESKALAKEIAFKFQMFSFMASINLAKEKGMAPILQEENALNKYVNSQYIQNLSEDLRTGILTYGVRNTHLTSIAPNGTIALTVGNNTSGGIEPPFALEYNRKIKTGQGEDDYVIETVYDESWLKYQSADEHFGKEVEVPEYFTVAYEVDPYDKIDIISIFQERICTAISNTTNLRADFTYEEYKNLYLYGWKKGCKGVTTFWEGGSLAPVLSTKEARGKKDRDEIVYQYAPARPKDLECDIHEITVNKQRMLFAVGLYGEKPYEVFCEINDDNHVDCSKHKHGIIQKRKKGCYDLIIDGQVVAQDLSHTFNEDFLSLARTLSMSLRHGVPLQFICDQMNKDSKFGSFQKGIARVLKTYIKEGEEVKSRNNNTCPECGGRLVYTDGCKQCIDCGMSYCG